MHQYDDSYLHNEALEINFWGLEISEDLLLIGHFIFVLAHRFSYVPPSRICLYPYINSRLLAPAYPP
ncbi:hypothetical protein T4C_11821 [Trichinella pseudospiralis]|uniref:Uncharacterized protein n=1 Tax=Trichinella pseudospiralis TaxID=6337 RepID=A0A0V1JPQ3_TRIPS|nr:hypothetical protein T4C_11821 [Trichinella pseudospiralis]